MGNIIDPNGEKIERNLIKILMASANEDYEKVKDIGDETYYLYLDGFFRNCRLVSELEELISMKKISLEHMKYFLESIISSIKESANSKYKLLKLYEKVQEKYGITNAPD